MIKYPSHGNRAKNISSLDEYREFRRLLGIILEPPETYLVFSKNNITGRGTLEVVNLTTKQQGEITIEPTYPRLINTCQDSQVVQFPVFVKD